MKILFVDPGRVSESWYTERQTPNVGLAYMGTYLGQMGHEVKIIDMAAYKIDVETLKKIVKGFKPDILGVTATSCNILPAYEVLWTVKKVDDQIFTVIGGAHATALPDKTLEECTAIDAVVIGEGEKAMETLCDDPQPGLHQEQVIKDLDSLPFPDWGLFDYSQYAKAYSLAFKEEKHIYTLITSRGCPFRCKFCFPLHGRKVRYRSIENVLFELKRNYNTYGATFFYIADSTLTIDRRRIEMLCERLIDSELPISFKCQSRVDLITKEMVQLLKEAGCELLFFGIESGNDEILKRCGKNTTKEAIKTAVLLGSEAGLCVRASFIIGLEGETRDTVRETRAFVKELKECGLDQAQFHCLDLYPGTEYWHMVERGEGELRRTFKDPYDWSVFSRENPHITTGDLTITDIKEYRNNLMVEHEQK